MFEKNTITRHKNEHRVIVTLTGQPPFEAYVFLKVSERLIDLLNDQRMFIPIKRADGATMIAAKHNIVSIIERAAEEPVEAVAPAEQAPAAETAPKAAEEAPKAEPPKEEAGAEETARAKPGAEKSRAEEAPERRGKRRNFDPYEILRIAKNAGPEEIRKAYHARMKQVHPDAIASLDLDEDLERAANISARRVNRAYHILMHDRGEPPKPEETARSEETARPEETAA